MGYTTTFEGVLRFKQEPTIKQLSALAALFEEDCREHPEWDAPGLYAIDLKMAADFAGIEWNGMEKTYDLDKLVNVVIRQMRKTWPDFGLEGSMLAQGEDLDDRWVLTIGEDGFAQKQKVALTGKRMTCPHCGKDFLLSDTE